MNHVGKVKVVGNGGDGFADMRPANVRRVGDKCAEKDNAKDNVKRRKAAHAVGKPHLEAVHIASEKRWWRGGGGDLRLELLALELLTVKKKVGAQLLLKCQQLGGAKDPVEALFAAQRLAELAELLNGSAEALFECREELAVAAAVLSEKILELEAKLLRRGNVRGEVAGLSGVDNVADLLEQDVVKLLAQREDERVEVGDGLDGVAVVHMRAHREAGIGGEVRGRCAAPGRQTRNFSLSKSAEVGHQLEQLLGLGEEHGEAVVRVVRVRRASSQVEVADGRASALACIGVAVRVAVAKNDDPHNRRAEDGQDHRESKVVSSCGHVAQATLSDATDVQSVN
eukprot:m.58647 g.58647  ORF g.58647 m.58647 type:complete len:341 (+) comp7160_c1_seq1:1827-2849(+)